MTDTARTCRSDTHKGEPLVEMIDGKRLWSDPSPQGINLVVNAGEVTACSATMERASRH